MKAIIRILAVLHGAVAVLFASAAVLLIGNAALHLWAAGRAGLGHPDAPRAILEAIGLLAVALVAVEITQTVIEEEIVRAANISAPTRVRRYLSRFLVVVVVALAIETLVATFEAQHESAADLRYAALVGLATAAILVGWGVFVHLNRSAEDLEPEAMRKATGEDAKVE
jgi:hypothetical protein